MALRNVPEALDIDGELLVLRGVTSWGKSILVRSRKPCQLCFPPSEAYSPSQIEQEVRVTIFDSEFSVTGGQNALSCVSEMP